MNKPAHKEPSMDEILSSIRQIIADDEGAAAPSQPPPAERPHPAAAEIPPPPAYGAAPPPPAQGVFSTTAPRPEAVERHDSEPVPEAAAPRREEDFSLAAFSRDAEEDSGEPLALSPDQIVPDEDQEARRDDPPAADAPDAAPVSHEADDAPEPAGAAPADAPPPLPELDSSLVFPDDVTFDPSEDEDAADDEPAAASAGWRRDPEPRPASETAPMPDPRLSADIAEELLEPATGAAVRHAFSRLNALPLGNHGVTIEEMIREMLRPMLKEWLDENLPAIVERMVEKEIERVSRGVD